MDVDVEQSGAYHFNYCLMWEHVSLSCVQQTSPLLVTKKDTSAGE